MAQADNGIPQNLSQSFIFYTSEKELFEAHIEYLKTVTDEDDVVWATDFGRVGLQGYLED